MGKKRSRSSVTSKGERRSVVAGVKAAGKDRTAVEKSLDLLKAWKTGKNPWISVPNNEKGTNRPFNRVRANAYWGNPKDAGYSIFRGKTDDQ